MTNNAKTGWTGSQGGGGGERSAGVGDRGVGMPALGGGASSGLQGEAAIGLSSPKKGSLGRGAFRGADNSGEDINIPPLSNRGNSSQAFELSFGKNTIFPSESSDGKKSVQPFEMSFGKNSTKPSEAPDGKSSTKPSEPSESKNQAKPGEPTDGKDSSNPSKPGAAANSWWKFDSAKSVSDLLKETSLKGKFVAHDTQPAADDKDRVADKLQQGETPKISIAYNEAATQGSSKTQPDFIVKEDGTIVVVNNPEKNPDREIIIQVEKSQKNASLMGAEADGKESGMPEAQQQSLLGLSSYMAERITLNPEYVKLSSGKLEIDDKNNLLKELAEKNQKPELKMPEIPPVPPAVEKISDAMNGIRNGGGSGSFDRGSINDATSGPRTVPPAFDELPPVQAMKETLAAMFKPDEKEPYQTVRRDTNSGYRVGRYGMSGRNAGNWLGMLLAMDPELAAILGDPPDYSKLQEYLKKHPDKAKNLQAKMDTAMKQGMQGLAGQEKVKKEFGEKFNDPEFSQGFSEFVGKLGDSNTPQSEIEAGMKTYLPEELQETMNQQLVENYAKQIVGDKNPDHITPEDAGKIGLAMLMGRVPTEAEFNNPNYKAYTEATQNFYQLARAGQFGPGPIIVTEHNRKLVAAARGNVGEALWAQSPWAGVCEGGNLGCAASVSMVLKELGVRVTGSASVVELSNQLAAAGYDRIPITSMSQYRPGDVVYGATGGGGGGNGHIGIIGEVTNGQVWQYDNSSSTGQWTHHTVQQGGSFVPGGRFGQGELFVMRRRGT